jgi:hypothetical protein
VADVSGRTGVNLDAGTTTLCDEVGIQLFQRLGRPVRGRTETIRIALEELHHALTPAPEGDNSQ